jgi:hypothetical protein
MPRKNKIDWEKLGKEWRTGQFSNIHLAEKYDISEAAIRKKAKLLEWEKDLTEEYKKEVENQLLKESTMGKYEEGANRTNVKKTESLKDDRETIKQAANIAVEVIKKHRRRINELSELHDILKSKLNVALTEEPDEKNMLPSLRGFKNGHESVFDILSKLTGITVHLTKMERQAFNMDTEEGKQTVNVNTTPTKIEVIGVRPADESKD